MKKTLVTTTNLTNPESASEHPGHILDMEGIGATFD